MVPDVCLVFAMILLTTTMSIEASKSSEEEMQAMMACVNLTKPEVAECCSIVAEMKENILNADKCNTQEAEMACEKAKCLLKEDGLDPDNIDLIKANKKLDETVEKHSELKNGAARIKSNCFEDRRFEMYPPEDCPAASLVLCTYINSITECPQWKDSDQCQKFAEDAKICKRAIDIVDNM